MFYRFILCLTLIIGIFQLVSASNTSAWLTSFSPTLPNLKGIKIQDIHCCILYSIHYNTYLFPITIGRMFSIPSPGAMVLCIKAGSSSQLDLSVKEKVRITALAPSLHTGYTCPYFRTAESPASHR